jgi:hypothetical protein
VSNEGDGGGRESDREYNQAGHWRPIVPEISERGIVSRIEGARMRRTAPAQAQGDAERWRARKKNASSAPPTARNTG